MHGQRVSLLDGGVALSGLHGDRLITLCHGQFLVFCNRLCLIPIDSIGLIRMNEGAVIMFNHLVQIALGMDVQQLFAFAVIKLDFVIAATARRAGRTYRADVLRSRESVRNRIFAVLDPPDDQWSVGISFEKLDHHLLTHARNEHPALTCTAPRLTHPNPA